MLTLKHHHVHTSLWGQIPAGAREFIITVAAGLLVIIVAALANNAKTRYRIKHQKSPIFVKAKIGWRTKKYKRSNTEDE